MLVNPSQKAVDSSCTFFPDRFWPLDRFSFSREDAEKVDPANHNAVALVPGLTPERVQGNIIDARSESICGLIARGLPADLHAAPTYDGFGIGRLLGRGFCITANPLHPRRRSEEGVAGNIIEKSLDAFGIAFGGSILLALPSFLMAGSLLSREAGLASGLILGSLFFCYQAVGFVGGIFRGRTLGKSESTMFE